MTKLNDIGENFLSFLRNLSSQTFLFSVAFFVLKSTLQDDKFVNNKWLGWLFFAVLVILALVAVLVNFYKFGFSLDRYFSHHRLWVKGFVWTLFIICATFLLVATVITGLKFVGV